MENKYLKIWLLLIAGFAFGIITATALFN